MRRENAVDVPLLFQLWSDMTITRGQVAERMGVSGSQLTRLLTRYRLPPRPYNYNNKANRVPVEEEAASRSSLAIAPALRAACEAVKAKHFAERRSEPVELIERNDTKRLPGVCQPR